MFLKVEVHAFGPNLYFNGWVVGVGGWLGWVGGEMKIKANLSQSLVEV